MTPLSAFRSRIAPRVPTALDMAIDQAVLDTCIDFCEQTLIVKATLAQVNTVIGQREYPVTAVSGVENICRVMRAWCVQTELAAIAEDDAGNPFMYVDAIAGAVNTLATPRSFAESSPGNIALFPTPDKVYPLTLRAALKPKRTATTVQDILYENWVEDIVNGAMYRLHSMPAMPFTNEGLATAHLALYRTGVNKALLEANRGRIRAERMIRPMFV